MPKETGMMFKGPLVHGILEGRKTLTRRICKPQPTPDDRFVGGHSLKVKVGTEVAVGAPYVHMASPTGGPGNLIYVRETWNPDPPCDGTWAYTQWSGCRQGQIEGMPERFRSPEYCNYEASWQGSSMVWTPSIHMPKWAARIWLEITDVRVERLQSITTEDCIAEGLSTTLREHDAEVHLRQQFKELWESTGASWDANPWVWVYGFKRTQLPTTKQHPEAGQ